MYGSVSTIQHIQTAHSAEACSNCTPATARSRGAVATATTWIGSWATTGRGLANGSPSSSAVPENDTPSSWAVQGNDTPSSWVARENVTRSSSVAPGSGPLPMTSWLRRPNAVCSIQRSSRSPAPPPAPSGSDASTDAARSCLRRERERKKKNS